MSIVAVAGSAFTYYLPGLEDQANPGLFKAAPTISAGDFTISINGGAFGALDNTPTVSPAGGTQIAIVLSAAETTEAGAGGRITVNCQDTAGAEWYSVGIAIPVQAKDISTFDGGTINSVVGTVGGVTGLTPATVAAAILATPAYKIATLSGGEIVISPETVVAAYVENLSPTAQQEASNGVNNLAPAGSGATGSIRAKLDAIKLITDAIDTTAVTVTSSNNAGVLTFTKGVTFAATVSGLTISGTWSKLYFTLKESDYDTDDLALIQIVVTNPAAGTDGLLYLDGSDIASPIVASDGTLTVNQAGGTVAIALTDNATVRLNKTSSLVWDIKTKDAAGATVQNAVGTASITQSVTQTI